METRSEPPPLILAHLRGLWPDIVVCMAKEINQLLWTFEWSYPDGQPRGEIRVDTERGLHLVLSVWVPDNDSVENRDIKELTVTRRIDYRPAALQIRAIIHWFLNHEADEQMFFDGVRVFDPHCIPGQDTKTDGSYIRSDEHRHAVSTKRAEMRLI